MVHRADNIYSTPSRPVIRALYWSDENSCDTKTESCHEYMSRGEPIVDVYKVPTVYTGEKLEHTYVPETHRGHLRAIVKFVCELHEQGRSLESLDESNIVFHNYMLRLRGLNFVNSLGAEDRERDFTLLHNLLESLFDKYNYNKYILPESIVSLLVTIKRCSKSKGLAGQTLEERLPYHLGLLRHDISIEYIKNFSGSVWSMLSDQEKASYGEALREMFRSEFYKKDWTEWFNGDYPQAGPAQDCFQYEPPKKCGYVGVGSDRVVNGSILRFCRNMATHLHEHIPKHNNGSEFSKKDVDLIIMAMFEDELLSFQRLTFEHRIAKHFIPAGLDHTLGSVGCGSTEQHHTSSSGERGGGEEGGGDAGWERQGRQRKYNKSRF